MIGKKGLFARGIGISGAGTQGLLARGFAANGEEPATLGDPPYTAAFEISVANATLGEA